MQYRYTKTLNKKIKKLNLNYEDIGELLVCLYLNGCPEEDCAKLFDFTLDSIIDYLKYEQIYGYKICNKCEKLKERNDIEFKNFRPNRKDTYTCTECEKLKKSQYYLEHIEERKKYRKKHYKEDYEKNKEKRKNYYLENKEHKKKYEKKYRNKLASKNLLQKLKLYEEVSGNQIKCRYCGDWYTPTVMEVRNRLRGILKNDIMYIYCSEECKEACPIFRKQLYSKGFKKASSREVNPVLRQLVFERDQYTCQKCFTHKDELNCPLHCHHINPYINSPIEGNDPDNCITLCKDCHKEVHQIPGCEYTELRCR